MATMTNFKIVTRDVMIEGDHYYLVRFNLVGMSVQERNLSWLSDTMYGTIDKNLVDENGKTIRTLVLAELWADKTIPEALERRNNYYRAMRTIEELKHLNPEEFKGVRV